MLDVLRNPVFAKLFGAQVIALLGTGLLTVALGLLAYDIAGGDAGLVLGTALTIKMVAYVGVSPLTTALCARFPRKAVLLAMDVLRAGIAVSLIWVTEAWQIYLLIFLLQSASATFTPTFQAVIPTVLPDEKQYTRALSLSRLAYDLESLVSPVIAAALLTVMNFHLLFAGTVVGFLSSALLVWFTVVPRHNAPTEAPFRERIGLGLRLFWQRRELRAVLWCNLAVAGASALVIVNTVVLVQRDLGRPQSDVALALAAYGAGSMVVALVIPRMLERLPDRAVMLSGASALPVLLVATAVVFGGVPVAQQYGAVLALWALMGVATSLVLTPTARVIRRNSGDADRPAVFAAQFALSHACFLVTYPIAGVGGTAWGLVVVAVVLAVVSAIGVCAAVRAWQPHGAHRGQ